MRLIRRIGSCVAMRGAILLTSLACVAPLAGAQTTKTVVVAKDSTIRGGTYASSNFGSDAVLATRSSNDSTYERRAVLTFDTEATIPDNTTIQSASLVLTVRGGNAETRPLSAYAVPISFDEEAVNWIVRNASSRWSYAGGDVADLPPASANATNVSGATVSFDVTAAVQNVIKGTYGSRYARFLVMDEGGSSRDSYKEFHSAQSSDSARRPRLVVVYGSTTGGTTGSASEVVLSAAAATKRSGKWVLASDSGAAGGSVVRHPDAGASKVSSALASPANYFEMTFTAQAGVPYRLWIHGKADGDSWANDSVFVQFSGSATGSGSATTRIGTTSAVEVNLEDCSNCGLSGWKWQDNGWGGKGALGPAIYFATSGTQTIRVQTREDGLSIDQIRLSPSTYLTSEPAPMDSSTSDTSDGTDTPAPAPSTTTTLRVLHWNTHHGGYGTDGVYSPERVANWIVKMKPDIISLNEIEYYTGWGNEDQPARYASLLKQKTGVPWYYKFVTASGATKANGNLILSRFPFDTKDSLQLSYSRSVAQVTIVVNGRTINFLSTHLDDDSSSQRSVEIGELQAWASGLAEQRIIAGDFNAWPGATEIAKMTKSYYDSWAEAVKAGTAIAYAGNTAGNTRNSRIDYIFYSHGASGLVLKSSQVYDTRDANGVMPSDHRPLVSTFIVK